MRDSGIRLGLSNNDIVHVHVNDAPAGVPVECEPFDQDLRDMDNAPALQATIDSLNRLWALIA